MFIVYGTISEKFTFLVFYLVIPSAKCFLRKCQASNVPSKVIVHLIIWQKATISVRWINTIFSVSHSAADIGDYTLLL